MTKLLTDDALTQALADLPQWRHDPERKALHRQIVLKDFGQALGLMVEIGLVAQQLNHHPEWANVYNRLDIWLTTHDVGGISLRDTDLAVRIDRIVARN
ncbi:4a-hydroxytetrahydrobiopterin dehydratase [Novosphingobium rosa]|uniref:4a-hydroxytetrahydrobiopterin dehydratase n=1 Tax=Novosphingobium rosa TaxID=76978 RepID=UPI00083032DF|nr:4a-hydroxytetrahydrobiopterin dehydratase [Novosphingobium rosa]